MLVLTDVTVMGDRSPGVFTLTWTASHFSHVPMSLTSHRPVPCSSESTYEGQHAVLGLFHTPCLPASSQAAFLLFIYLYLFLFDILDFHC